MNSFSAELKIFDGNPFVSVPIAVLEALFVAVRRGESASICMLTYWAMVGL